MLDGVERLVDLVGVRRSGSTDAADVDVVEAVRSGDAGWLAAIDGHFAATARDGRTVRLARTLGFPLRYFVAKMYHGPILIAADRMDRIFDWCQEQRIGWQFDPAYTRMVPAHYLVAIDQVGCPDPAPRYQRFFTPSIATSSADIEEAGARYIEATYAALKKWLEAVPHGEPIAVAFSGGVDSTSIVLLARHALAALGRHPDTVRAFTLDVGGGADAVQARDAMSDLGLEHTWEPVTASPADIDLERAISVIEDYHPLEVECAATALCLLEGIRARDGSLTYLLDGDGGDENLKSYPLEDSDLTLSSVLRNPLLYQEGWGVDAIKHSLTYSGGLSRGYVRTYAPAAAYGFNAFSPYTVRSVIGAALSIPFAQVLGGRQERLSTLKQDVVRAGVKAVTGIDMPVHPKRRFQDGVVGAPRARVSKAWCRSVFTAQWEQRLRKATDILEPRRSGNEVPAVTS